MSLKRIVIAAGGTGGHLFPGIAVANEMCDRADVQITIIISDKKIDREISKNLPWEILTLKAPTVAGKKGFGFLSSIFKLFASIKQSLSILKKSNADVVLGIGGFIGGPFVFAAWLKGIPSIIVEPNAVAGRSNRILSHFAKKVCIAFPESEKYFAKKKVLLTGNPIRTDLNMLKANPTDLVILGGSQGAKGINELVLSALSYLKSSIKNLKIVHQTGKADYELAKTKYDDMEINAKVYPFIEDMSSVYSSAKLIVSRSGAGAVAEIMSCGVPVIFIPYPFATDDHQYANAMSLSKIGAAVVKREAELDDKKLAELIKDLWSNDEKSSTMKRMQNDNAKRSAAKVVADECLKLIRS